MQQARYIAILLLVLLPACAAAPVKPSAVRRGIEIETLQGPVAIALDSKAGKIGGQGIIFYQRPDRFRLSIIAPFGQIIMDIIVKGDDVLCLMPSKKKGWRGVMSDLPESLGTRIWPLMRWVVEPPRIAGPAVVREYIRTDGTNEKVYFDADGLVQRKVSAEGDEVLYGDYRTAAEITMPNIIEVSTSDGSRLKLTFDDPEVNRPLDEGIMTPTLDGLEILPLSEMRGLYQ